ncbi:methyltransferase [bacterium]|nr:MAG: methyltransferase [bacterium]
MNDEFGTYALRLFIALLIGGLIGLEREFKGKPAGIRTNMLMCTGSALIMIISIEIAKIGKGHADPGRIAAQVITGIGFLGAGTIIRSKFHVMGLTTAATIWVLSALGLAIGAGYIALAVYGAILITITLTVVSFVEAAMLKRRKTHVLLLTLEPREGIIGEVLESFSALKVVSEALEVNRSDKRWTMTLEYTTSRKLHEDVLKSLSKMSGISNITEL